MRTHGGRESDEIREREISHSLSFAGLAHKKLPDPPLHDSHALCFIATTTETVSWFASPSPSASTVQSPFCACIYKPCRRSRADGWIWLLERTKRAALMNFIITASAVFFLFLLSIMPSLFFFLCLANDTFDDTFCSTCDTSCLIDNAEVEIWVFILSTMSPSSSSSSARALWNTGNMSLASSNSVSALFSRDLCTENSSCRRVLFAA